MWIFKTLLEKGFEFISSKEDSTLVLNLGLLLLLVEFDPILKEQGCKKDTLVANSASRVKIILALLTKIVAVYM